jgi:hypothetical protein
MDPNPDAGSHQSAHRDERRDMDYGQDPLAEITSQVCAQTKGQNQAGSV